MQVIIESQFMPPISTFAYFARVECVLIEIMENYQKRSYRNRCNILSSTGPMPITIPLKKGKNNQQNIKEVLISYDQPWTNMLIKQIRSAYGKSPYFDFYFDELCHILELKPDFLFDLNQVCLQFMLKQLRLDLKIELTTAFNLEYPKGAIDLRNKISPVRQIEIPSIQFTKYPQVFEDKFGFRSNLSILDLLFNMGPESSIILEDTKIDLDFYSTK